MPGDVIVYPGCKDAAVGQADQKLDLAGEESSARGGTKSSLLMRETIVMSGVQEHQMQIFGEIWNKAFVMDRNVLLSDVTY